MLVIPRCLLSLTSVTVRIGFASWEQKTSSSWFGKPISHDITTHNNNSESKQRDSKGSPAHDQDEATGKPRGKRKGHKLDWPDFLDKIYNDEEFLSNVHKYINISTTPEEISVTLDKDALKKDYFQLFSYESSSLPDVVENMGSNVKFNDVKIENKRFTSIYKKSRKMYNNIDSLLDNFIKEIAPTSLINNVYDDYKEKLKQSNNSGEQSTGQNQVFEFQML